MSNDDELALNNAGEIIERFGGIRPMAAKIDAPVTTVQGWKKRDVIPGARRDQVLSAASENNIDISDLTNGSAVANQNTARVTETAQAPTSVPSSVQQERPAPQKQETPGPSSGKSSSTPAPAHDSLMMAIEANNRKAMAASAWIATGLILFAGAVAAFVFWPSVKENNMQIEAQSEKLVELEGEVDAVTKSTSFIKDFVPENFQEKMDRLQNQARNIQNTVEQLSEQASEISTGVLGADAGPISKRLEILEEKMAALSGGEGNFGGLISRIRNLEDSVSGQEQIKSSVDELRSIVDNMSSQQELDAELNDELAEAQGDEEGALGQTLEGVSGNDLKAAAMLIAFSQLRDSLNRSEPFEEDLVLLEKLAGDDNPELNAALERLAPHADGGVLSSEGLSEEFKTFAGDIVFSSLKGEDVSFKEKAKARIGNILQVEKEGELVTGTETQATVSKAQKLLDEGNIQGAIAELQTLDGEAAKTAQPFIQEAQVSLLAEKAQQLLGEDILSKISGQLPMGNMGNMGDMMPKALKDMGVDKMLGGSLPQGQGSSAPAPSPAPSPTSSFDMNEVKKNLESAVPFTENNEVIRDEASGITILPSQPGFKGFSGGGAPKKQ